MPAEDVWFDEALIGESEPEVLAPEEFTAVRSSTDDLVRLYLQEIGRIPLLKGAEEIELARRIATWLQLDEKRRKSTLSLELWLELEKLPPQQWTLIVRDGERAKAHLVKANLRLVVSVAKKYQGRGLHLLDLIQEGTLGLIRAAGSHDPPTGSHC
jgi:DNA-directed RNA polymerase sigma subunit (sigma70/sigma32)